jgi:hypothetical protein
MDCGRRLGSKRSKAEAPPARQLTTFPSEEGTRFHGRAAWGTIALPVAALITVGLMETLFGFVARPSAPAWVALFVALPVLTILWLVLMLIRTSDVVVTRSGVTIRSFPFAGRAAGMYPRDDIAHFGWIRSPGAERSYTYDVWIELRDGRRIRVPFDVEGEGQSVYVVKKLRRAFEAAT